MESGEIAGRHQVVAALLVRSDAVLLCHRTRDREWYPDVWDLPGGHVEPNETPVNALVRELQEELGVTVPESLGNHSFSLATEEFEMRVWITHQWTGSPENRAPQEHDEIGWFTAEDVLSLQIADPDYRNWIMEALGSTDAGPRQKSEKEKVRNDPAQQ